MCKKKILSHTTCVNLPFLQGQKKCNRVFYMSGKMEGHNSVFGTHPHKNHIHNISKSTYHITV